MFFRKKYFFFLAVLILGNAGCATAPSKVLPPVNQLSAAGIYHTVLSGQTLWRISKAYNVDLRELMRLNGITDAGALEVGQKLFIPGVSGFLPLSSFAPDNLAEVEKIIGPRHYSSHWRTITIHHSATLEGNAGSFDRNHRKRGMGGLFYHFVIGNGTGSGDGEIEVGTRWKKQAQVNRPNDIQICLVGDFERENISDKQLDRLIKLITVLREEYNIPLNNIRKHNSIRGKHTACPGRSFPFDRIIRELRRIKA